MGIVNPRDCRHGSHTPKGICLGCGEQHEPLPGYSAEELEQREAEFWAEDATDSGIVTDEGLAVVVDRVNSRLKEHASCGCPILVEQADLRALTRTLADERKRVGEVAHEATFLIARINELDWCGDLDSFAREWSGHVDPPLSRLTKALASLSQRPTEGEG